MTPDQARFAAVIAILAFTFAVNVVAAIIERKRNK